MQDVITASNIYLMEHNSDSIKDDIKDLRGADAIKKMQELTGKSDTCFFTSNIKTGLQFSARPMSVRKCDDEGNFWFLSSKDSRKNEELASDPFVQLLFQGSSHSDYMNIYGMASISDNKEKIKELWSPLLKTWFTEGEDDPRISVIKVETLDGFYWDNKHGNAVANIKIAIGAAIGKTLDDSIEGKLEA